MEQKIQKQDFLKFLPGWQKQELLQCAKELQGKKVVHVNATAQGGGVAELLKSVIPYMQALGVDASWHAIDAKKAGKGFFAFTNSLHNALQGTAPKFSGEDWANYEKVNQHIAKDLEKMDYDILVIHDPQPLASRSFLGENKPSVAVIHIDTSAPDQKAWNKIENFIAPYNRLFFSNKNFVNKDIPKEKLHVFAPAIDPLAPKQHIVSKKKAREYLAKYGIPAEGQLLVQVSRFDVWKNPHGVVEAFWLLQKKYPKANLMLVGLEQARDNPQAEKVYMDMRAMVGKNPNIFLFFEPKRIGGAKNIGEFTAMAQNAADIVVQNSIKEGFGLTITEGMWKEKPVVGGPASGVRRQIMHGKNGYIAKNTKELTKYVGYLLANPAEQKRIGKAGKESVREHFLMPRFVLDHLNVYKEII